MCVAWVRDFREVEGLDFAALSVSAHKKGPQRARALPLNQPDDAYIVLLSMERIPTRRPGATQAQATRDYSRGFWASEGVEWR